MALIWADRIRETSLTDGLGDITVGGAVTRHATFASVLSTSDTCYGCIEHQSANEWQACLFTLQGDGTLARTTTLGGSNGLSDVSFSAGLKHVYLGLPATVVAALFGLAQVVMASDSVLPNERVLTAGSGISIVDGGAGSTVTISNDSPGVTDHGGLTGLSDDDHTQYALLAGRSGGQTLTGGTGASESITIQSTSHATKGTVTVGGSVIIQGGSSPLRHWYQTSKTLTNTSDYYADICDMSTGGIPKSGVVSVKIFRQDLDGAAVAEFILNSSISSDAWRKIGFITQTVGSGGAVLHGKYTNSTGVVSLRLVSNTISLKPATYDIVISVYGPSSVSFSDATGTGTTSPNITYWPITWAPEGTALTQNALTWPYGTAATIGGTGGGGSITIAAASGITFQTLQYGPFVFSGEVSNTSTVANAMSIKTVSAGTPGAGFGAAVAFQLESSIAENRDAGLLSCSWIDATDASRLSRVSLSAYYTSTAQEGLRIDAQSGGTPKIVLAPSDGVVGINQTSPDSSLKLDVNGNFRASRLGLGTVPTGSHIFDVHVLTPPNDTVFFAVGDQISGGSEPLVYFMTDGTSSLIRERDDQWIYLESHWHRYTLGIDPNGHIRVTRKDAMGVPDIQDLVTIRRQAKSGTPTNGDGNAIRFQLGSTTTADQNAARITASWGDATHASREGILSLYATDYGGDRLGVQVTGNGSATELGFYDTTPVIQYATTGTTTGFTAGSGTGVNDDSTFTGNTGSTAYTIGDIVRALKLIGIIAS